MGSTPLRARGDRGGPGRRSRPPTTAYARLPTGRPTGTNPPSDLNGDADYRKHLATVLTRRAVLAAAGSLSPWISTHRFTVPVAVEETWAHFQDIASVAECFPGAQVTDDRGRRRSTGSVKVKLGPIALVYNGSGTFTEKDEAAHRFVVDAKGKDKRGNGTAGATVTLTMAGRPATRPTSRCTPTSRSPASPRSSAAG